MEFRRACMLLRIRILPAELVHRLTHLCLIYSQDTVRSLGDLMNMAPRVNHQIPEDVVE